MSAAAITRPGYRHTEMGPLPADWELERIGNVAAVGSGGTPRREVRSYWGGSIPWVTTSQIDFNTIQHADQFITEAGLRNSAAKLLPAGTLLMALYGQGKTRGKVGMLAVEAATNQACASIIPSQTVAREFLLYFLASRYDAIRNASNSGGQENLSGKIVKDLPIAIPSASEQGAIASALSDVDALLAKLDALITKKRDLKQATMQQLLTGQTRLKRFSGEWDRTLLGDLFTFKNGLNKAKGYFGFGTPIVNYLDVFSNVCIVSSQLRGLVSLSPQEITNFDVKKGDVLFTRTSETPDEIGMAALVLDEPNQTVFSGFLLRARPRDDRLCDAFKAYCFRSSFVRRQIISKASYTTRALTNGRQLSSVLLPLPSRAEQLAIATVLADVDAELASLEARRNKTRALKLGMMQQLLTGRIRLV